MSDIFESVVDIMHDRFGIAREALTPAANFEEIGLDSLSELELGIALKKAFAVDITDDDLDDISTVEEVVSWLEVRLADTQANQAA